LRLLLVDLCALVLLFRLCSLIYSSTRCFFWFFLWVMKHELWVMDYLYKPWSMIYNLWFINHDLCHRTRMGRKRKSQF
jgi:hypothetical protein